MKKSSLSGHSNLHFSHAKDIPPEGPLIEAVKQSPTPHLYDSDQMRFFGYHSSCVPPLEPRTRDLKDKLCLLQLSKFNSNTADT